MSRFERPWVVMLVVVSDGSGSVVGGSDIVGTGSGIGCE